MKLIFDWINRSAFEGTFKDTERGIEWLIAMMSPEIHATLDQTNTFLKGKIEENDTESYKLISNFVYSMSRSMMAMIQMLYSGKNSENIFGVTITNCGYEEAAKHGLTDTLISIKSHTSNDSILIFGFKFVDDYTKDPYAADIILNAAENSYFTAIMNKMYLDGKLPFIKARKPKDQSGEELTAEDVLGIFTATAYGTMRYCDITSDLCGLDYDKPKTFIERVINQAVKTSQDYVVTNSCKVGALIIESIWTGYKSMFDEVLQDYNESLIKYNIFY